MKKHLFNRILWKIVTATKYKIQFNHIGKHTVIFSPLQLDEVDSVYIGDYVFLAKGAWIYGNHLTDRSLTIMDGTNIGHYAHIVAKHSVFIDKDVLIADRVFISDCTHNYDDVLTPIIKQPISNISAVRIGYGTWIGENVCICGATIGKHCVIGANSVVNNDIPDYSVAVGSPARVIKQYDFTINKWKKVINSSKKS